MHLSRDIAKKMSQQFNRILEEEASAYRIIDNLVVPLISEQEIESIETSLNQILVYKMKQKLSFLVFQKHFHIAKQNSYIRIVEKKLAYGNEILMHCKNILCLQKNGT